ncbi:MAG: SGNH/GDSL hydrolase family protein [Ruminococcaceae bacterium]|nr:SGNH/GDSL hydrolase family protein [Oscillospiraceae bacterium]
MKVTLLGDSIRRIGYGTKVPDVLGEEHTVYQPTDNCMFVKYTLRRIHKEWSEGIKGSDVIHWNNGLWDVVDYGDGPFSTVEEYVDNMVRVARLLQKQAHTVIFATTTPYYTCPGEAAPPYTNERIDAYNAAVVPRLREMGIIINDLNAFVKPHMATYIREDDRVHLTEAGIDACAAEVVRMIKQYL